MSDDQIKRFIYFVFDRFAPNHEPSEQQIEHVIKDFEANQPMTNYNERLDEILWYVYEAGAKSMEDSGGSDYEVNEAKSALTSLIKELVAEAKPKRHNTYVGDAYQCTFCEEYNKGIDQFEQNLLKALEEK